MTPELLSLLKKIWKHNVEVERDDDYYSLDAETGMELLKVITEAEGDKPDVEKN